MNEKCPVCQEEWFDEKTSLKIEELEKRKVYCEEEIVLHPEGPRKLVIEF